jgi:hypothetical protein
MTAQKCDRIWFEGKLLDLASALPIAPEAMIFVEDDSEWNTACWRRYVVTWDIRESRLYFRSATGIIRPVNHCPVEARWVTGHVLIADESERPNLDRTWDWHSDVLGHGPFGRRHGALIELDVVQGMVRRSRRIGMSSNPNPHRKRFSSAYWERIPEFDDFIRQRRESMLNGSLHADDPLEGEPQFEQFAGNRLRPRMIKARKILQLNFGEVMQCAGFSAGKGGKLADWERDGRPLSKEMENRLCLALKIGKEELAEIRNQEHQDYETARNEWADEIVQPVVRIAYGNGVFCYRVPDDVSGSDGVQNVPLMESWASTLSQIAWQSSELVLSRRQTIRFDEFGTKIP